jgi:hypothetical protein
MAERLVVGLWITGFTLLSFFVFPGHTWVQQDTQLYVPMLEHIWDGSTLAKDLVATSPHLSYTLYDEIAIALRWVTRASFQAVLVAQQLLFRALEILGVYLLVSAFPLSRRAALLVAGVFALGAIIDGPAVLTFEYEPVPRGFAVGLILLAVGLAARGRMLASALAASVAFLYHPPTVYSFWVVFVALALWRREWRALVVLVCAVGALLVAAKFQVDVSEKQVFWARIDAPWEALQRMRAPYNWVSTWRVALFWQYAILWVLSAAAYWRLRPQGGRAFLLGMPVIGMLSVPASYLLLERMGWALIPQFQPARALLFVTAVAVILAASAGARAAETRRWIEAALWFVVVFAVPMQGCLVTPQWPLRHWVLAVGLAILAAVAMRFEWAPVVAVAACVLLPTFGRVENYPRWDRSDLLQLAAFARERTDKDAVFIFADAGKNLYPGMFRAESERSVYVDWKSGGQVNYYKNMGEEWWRRWQSAHGLVFERSRLPELQKLGIDYLVLGSSLRLADRSPIYENRGFVVYRLDARNVSTSARVGTDAWAPGRVTEMDAAALANRSASAMGRSSASATASAALKISPAAVVSRARAGKPGLKTSASAPQ